MVTLPTMMAQPRPKGDIKSTLEAARQRRLAMEQRSSKEVEQVRILMLLLMMLLMLMPLMLLLIMMIPMMPTQPGNKGTASRKPPLGGVDQTEERL